MNTLRPFRNIVPVPPVPRTVYEAVFWPIVVVRDVIRAVRARLPRYEHHCSNCVYLGQYREFDLYFCAKDLLGPTVIARYGVDGEYCSGIAFRDFDPALGEAFRRACERKLLRDEDFPKMVRCKGCNMNIIKQGTACALCKPGVEDRAEGQN